MHLLKKRDSISSYLKSDHILPMKQRVMYKSCVFVHNILHGNCPHYMKDMLLRRIPTEFHLRSNNDNLVLTQTTDSTTLQYGMIKNWNSLPYTLRSVSTSELFNKKTFKNALFLQLILFSFRMYFSWPKEFSPLRKRKSKVGFFFTLFGELPQTQRCQCRRVVPKIQGSA